LGNNSFSANFTDDLIVVVVQDEETSVFFIWVFFAIFYEIGDRIYEISSGPVWRRLRCGNCFKFILTFLQGKEKNSLKFQ